ncbi:MAG: hypothetical protein GXX09_08945 [Syntrophomonadaceae bacterium]|nr:hypothetical protein [Syntrophomonadaceae bacterium]
MLVKWVRDKTEKITSFQPRLLERVNVKQGWILALLAVVGVTLLLWPVSVTPEAGVEEAPVQGEPVAGDSVRAAMEAELSGILSRMNGVGRVNVSLTLASGGVRTYALNNREESREVEEGTSKTREINRTSDIAVSGNQSPILIEQRAPIVTGVLVVADGAVNPLVREQLTDAVVTLLGVPAHKVRVLPREPY